MEKKPDYKFVNVSNSDSELSREWITRFLFSAPNSNVRASDLKESTKLRIAMMIRRTFRIIVGKRSKIIDVQFGDGSVTIIVSILVGVYTVIAQYDSFRDGLRTITKDARLAGNKLKQLVRWLVGIVRLIVGRMMIWIHRNRLIGWARLMALVIRLWIWIHLESQLDASITINDADRIIFQTNQRQSTPARTLILWIVAVVLWTVLALAVFVILASLLQESNRI